MICLKLFYILTVYDEEFQDIVEAQNYKAIQNMCLEKHLLEGDNEHKQITAKFVYFISSNITRLKQWKRYVLPNGHQLMQEYLDKLSHEDTRHLTEQGKRLGHESRLPPPSTYYDITAQETCDIFKTDPNVGLSETEVKRRQEKYGKNELPKPKKTPMIVIFLRQFADLMVLILVITTIVCAAIQDFKSSVVLGLVVVFNVLVGFFQELKAERSLSALLTLNVEKSSLLRDGKITVINSNEIVPGDVVILEEGVKIPADLRLVEEIDLHCNEALLTGESVPVEKCVDVISKKDLPLGDIKNIAFMGTVVTKGRGKGIAIATGRKTEIGKISKRLARTKIRRTPLQKKLAILGVVLVVISFLLCAAVSGIGILRGIDWETMLKIGVSLAVSVIPEGLVAVTTVTMALGVNRMAKQNAVVRKLAAVETLGSVTVICSDKTGTLTEGKMTATVMESVNEQYNFGGDITNFQQKIFHGGQEIPVTDIPTELFQMLLISSLCNNATVQQKKDSDSYDVIGEPTECALQVAAFQAGIRKAEWVRENEFVFKNECAFDSERKRMSVIYQVNPQKAHFLDSLFKFYNDEEVSNLVTMTKGAVESVLEVCSHVQISTQTIKPLQDDMKKTLENRSMKMAGDGMRVLALAYRLNLSTDDIENDEDVEKSLIFIGLVGIIDPPRTNVAESIQICKDAGMRICMITGDHPSTAKCIAETLKILPPHADSSLIMQGKEFDELRVTNRLKTLKTIPAVFSRVSPENKYQIVEFLQNTDVVAMIGDGVNDASSIKKADVGVAMGKTGTDIAKQAASIILADDNFDTIVRAIKEGRRIYDNIIKFNLYLLSCNFSEIVVVFTAIAADIAIPFNAIHILYANLIADVPPSLCLGVEPAGPYVMKRLPRNPKSGIFSWRGWLFLLYQSVVIGGISLAGLAISLYVENYDLPHAQSFTFVLLISLQLVHAFHSRSVILSVFQVNPFSNLWLIAAVVLSFVLLFIGVYVPGVNTLLELVPLGWFDWVKVLCGLVIHFIMIEIAKVFFRLRRRFLKNGHQRFFSDV